MSRFIGARKALIYAPPAAAAPAAGIGTPVLVASGTKVNSTAGAITMTTSAAIPAGAFIYIALMSSAFKVMTSATVDGAAITTLGGGTISAGGFTNGANCSIAYGYTAGGYASGINIVVDTDAGAIRDCQVYYITGIAATSQLDGTAVNQATGTAPAVTLADTGSNVRIGMAIFGALDGDGDPTITNSSGYTQFPAVDNVNSTGHRLMVAYKQLAAGAAADLTLAITSRAYHLRVHTFKAA